MDEIWIIHNVHSIFFFAIGSPSLENLPLNLLNFHFTKRHFLPIIKIDRFVNPFFYMRLLTSWIMSDLMISKRPTLTFFGGAFLAHD